MVTQTILHYQNSPKVLRLAFELSKLHHLVIFWAFFCAVFQRCKMTLSCRGYFWSLRSNSMCSWVPKNNIIKICCYMLNFGLPYWLVSEAMWMVNAMRAYSPMERRVCVVRYPLHPFECMVSGTFRKMRCVNAKKGSSLVDRLGSFAHHTKAILRTQDECSFSQKHWGMQLKW